MARGGGGFRFAQKGCFTFRNYKLKKAKWQVISFWMIFW